MNKRLLVILLVVLLLGCRDASQMAVEGEGGETVETAVSQFTPIQYDTDDMVTITPFTLTWETYAYELDEHGGIVAGSFDGQTTMAQTFDTWILENETIKATILPAFGGRVISLIYKPTGHEQLYQNPLGVPYLIGENIFYYDWLMIYGGIFPTFPEPEHGKTWFLPWSFEIVEESDQQVTILMSFTDDIDSPIAPAQYDVGVTDITVDFYVTLTAGRSALDTRIVLTNPNDEAQRFEYWTNVGLAPGSEPGDTRATEAAEIIVPVEQVSIPGWSVAIAQQEQTANNGAYQFDALRDYENWPDMGIAYAYPSMGNGNFWGVINHENEEGLFRIANNGVTSGLKIWTFGYPQSVDLDPYATTDFNRPMIELWAGTTSEFWIRDSFPANGTIVIEETYAPTVGLSNVTHANHNLLANVWHGETAVSGQLATLLPNDMLHLSLVEANSTLHETSIDLTRDGGNHFTIPLPAAPAGLLLEIRNENDDLLMTIPLDAIAS